MRAPQARHRPRRSSQERTGMLSRSAMGISHCGQRERGRTTDWRRGTRWMTTLRNDPTQMPTTPQITATTAVTASEATVTVSRDDAEDLLDRGHACPHLGGAGLAEGHHPLGDGDLLDVLGVAPFHDQPLDVLGHEEHLVEGEAAVEPGLPAGLAPGRPEQLGEVVELL